MNRWVIGRRKRLIKAFGGKCEICGTAEDLEFAHAEPTGLNGWGRGRKERLYDVMKNRDKYRLLCKKCHRMFDSGYLYDHISHYPLDRFGKVLEEAVYHVKTIMKFPPHHPKKMGLGMNGFDLDTVEEGKK